MYNYNYNKYKQDETEDDDGTEDDDETEDDEIEDEPEEFYCRNIDPGLAKLMGILIEEQKIETDWKPPSKSGLDNSNPIFPCKYLQTITTSENEFHKIKNDIKHYNSLSTKQLEYIKNLTNQEKYELIEIYNEILQSRK